MGDVFLRPMMDNLNKSRGSVSAIFGILPAVTLATGFSLPYEDFIYFVLNLKLQ